MTLDLFAAARGHVVLARRGEGAVSRMLAAGRLDTLDMTRPWPEHDRALAREIWRDVSRCYLDAAVCLLTEVLA